MNFEDMTVSQRAMYRLGIKHGRQRLAQEQKMDFVLGASRHWYELGFSEGLQLEILIIEEEADA